MKMRQPSEVLGNALITGASAGIGQALGERFAKAGHDVVLVARSEDKLKEVAQQLSAQYAVKAWVVPLDLGEPDAAAKLFAKLKRARRPIDIVVNCAGVLEHREFALTPPERHQQLIDLNISSLTGLLAHFLPPMIERGQGRFLNVASIAAFQPIPLLATYAATKAYVLSITESLAEELRGTGVSVTALCPGITATEMLGKAQAGSQELGGLPDFLIGSAQEVAEQGFEACMRGDVICVPGSLNLVGTLAARAAPKWLVRRVGGAMVRRMRKG